MALPSTILKLTIVASTFISIFLAACGTGAPTPTASVNLCSIVEEHALRVLLSGIPRDDIQIRNVWQSGDRQNDYILFIAAEIYDPDIPDEMQVGVWTGISFRNSLRGDRLVVLNDVARTYSTHDYSEELFNRERQPMGFENVQRCQALARPGTTP